MYMYVYACICKYINVFCMYMNLYFYSKVGVKTSKYEKQYMQVYWCICMYMYVFVEIWTYLYVYIHIHTYTDMGWEGTHCQ